MKGNENPWKLLLSSIFLIVLALFCYSIQRKYTMWNIHEKILEFMSPYYVSAPYRTLIFLMTIFFTMSLVIYIFISLINCCIERYKKKQKEGYVPKGKISINEYKKVCNEYTKKQLQLLEQSKEYNTLLAKNGDDKGKWNWQTEERIARESKYGVTGKYQNDYEEIEEIDDE